MRPTTRLAPLLSLLLPSLLTSAAQTANSTTSPKRGLVYISSKHASTDDPIWLQSWTDLSWYYDYTDKPAASIPSSSHLSFVPMLFTAPSSASSTETAFLDSITSQVSSGANITHVLAYNEPDGDTSTGGSSIPADTAAASWMRNLAPLRRDHGIKLGLPAVTGSPNGINWLRNFNTSCEALNENGGCEADFIPVHWYGNFEGFASHLGQMRAAYPQLPIWVTEFALPGAKLKDVQTFYNTSIEYLDRLDYVDRYSWFGSFRSDASNVGAGNAFLTQKGDLTDLGSWYLGGRGTGKVGSWADGGRGGMLRETMMAVVVGAVVAMGMGMA
ncbi:MAG: hypothetical protein Q9160_003561 [Pyrenula sp. 1 TL-2023]